MKIQTSDQMLPKIFILFSPSVIMLFNVIPALVQFLSPFPPFIPSFCVHLISPNSRKLLSLLFVVLFQSFSFFEIIPSSRKAIISDVFNVGLDEKTSSKTRICSSSKERSFKYSRNNCCSS